MGSWRRNAVSATITTRAVRDKWPRIPDATGPLVPPEGPRPPHPRADFYDTMLWSGRWYRGGGGSGEYAMMSMLRMPKQRCPVLGPPAPPDPLLYRPLIPHPCVKEVMSNSSSPSAVLLLCECYNPRRSVRLCGAYPSKSATARPSSLVFFITRLSPVLYVFPYSHLLSSTFFQASFPCPNLDSTRK